jgi:hypothetical protein
MNEEQLERFGDYSAHRPVNKPFTWEELRQLVLKSEVANSTPPVQPAMYSYIPFGI